MVHRGRERGHTPVISTICIVLSLSCTIVSFLQMTPREMQQYLLVHASEAGDLWCHQDGCAGTYQPYRVNIWGLRNTENNQEESRLMLPQQVTNILRHLEKVHNIPKHEVVEDVLPFPYRVSFLHMTLKEMENYQLEHSNEDGDLWCQLEGCTGTHPPYHVNIWGLRKMAENRKSVT